MVETLGLNYLLVVLFLSGYRATALFAPLVGLVWRGAFG